MQAKLLQVVTCVFAVSPSLSELFAEGMLSSRSGMLSNVARSSLCTTIFSLPFDLSISFLASISDKFSVTVPLIWQSGRDTSAPEGDRPGNCIILAYDVKRNAHRVSSLMQTTTSFRTMILYAFLWLKRNYFWPQFAIMNITCSVIPASDPA